MKKYGFSLMEIMIIMLLVSLTAAATAPMITKKIDTNSSPWVWTSLTSKSIAYNKKNDINSTAIIGGTTGLPNHPRLLIHAKDADSNDNAKDPTPLITFGHNNANYIHLATGWNDTIRLSNRYEYVGRDVGTPFLGTTPITNNMQSNIGLGISANSYGKNMIALATGHNTAANNGASALGKGANASGAFSSALGVDSRASVIRASAMGYGANAAATNSTAIGAGATASANNTTAIGNGVTVSTANRTQIGSVIPDNNLRIGPVSTLNNTVHIRGLNTYTQYTYATRIGNNSKAAGHSVALGNSTDASPYSIAIGDSTSAGSNAVALGKSVEADIGSVNIGYNISNSGSSAGSAVIIGKDSASGYSGTVSIGYHNLIAASQTNSYHYTEQDYVQSPMNAITIGSNAYASGYNEINIGSIDSRTNKSPKDLNTTSNSGRISERQINHNIRPNDWTYSSPHTHPRVLTIGDANSTVYINGTLRMPLAKKTADDSYWTYYPYYSSCPDDMFTAFRKENVASHGGWGNNVLYEFNSKTSLDRIDLNQISDRRLKNVGKEFTGGLEAIKKLQVFNYTFKKDPNKTPRVGVIAQDLQKVFPNAVFEGKDGFLKIRMEDMFYALVNAVKELDQKVEQIAQQVNLLDMLTKQNEEKSTLLQANQKQLDDERIALNTQQKSLKKLEKRISKLERKML